MIKVRSPKMSGSQDVDSSKHSEYVSAEDLVIRQCEKLGLHEGVDENRDLHLVVASDCSTADSITQITERERHRAFVKAFDRALAKISLDLSSSIEDRTSCKTNACQSELRESTTELFSQNQVTGAFPVCAAESYDAAKGTYELSVAVVQSKKLADIMQSLNSPVGKPGKFSIDAWMENQDVSLLLGVRQFVDDHGERWLVSFVTDDGSISEYLRTWVRNTPNAGTFFGDGPEGAGMKNLDEVPVEYLKKMYCIWQIARSCRCDVRVRQKVFHKSRVDKTAESESDLDFEEEINVNPSFPSPFTPNNERLRYFEQKVKSSLSGRPVSVSVYAIRVNDIKKGEREYVSRRQAESRKSLDGAK